jgi:hypothetical protein
VEEHNHDQPETLPKYAAEENASKDNVPGDYIDADKRNVPNDVDGDHTHPDEGGVPKTPEEGDAQKSMDRKMSKKLSQSTTLTFQAEISAGKNMNQLTAGKEPETTVDSPPTAKVTGVEISKYTTQTRLVKHVTKSSTVITAEPTDPDVPTDAAHPTNVTSGASLEPTALTPTAAEDPPAEDKSEEAEEEATDEPVMENTPTIDTPTPPAATEASPTLEDIVTTFVVIPEQNRKATKKAPLRV